MSAHPITQSNFIRDYTLRTYVINQLANAAAMCVSLTTILLTVGNLVSGDKYVFAGKSDFDFWAILVLLTLQALIFFASLAILTSPPPAHLSTYRR